MKPYVLGSECALSDCLYSHESFPRPPMKFSRRYTFSIYPGLRLCLCEARAMRDPPQLEYDYRMILSRKRWKPFDMRVTNAMEDKLGLYRPSTGWGQKG